MHKCNTMFFDRVYRCLLFFLFALLVVACKKEDIHNGRVPLVSVDGAYLYKDEVELLYAAQGYGVDSATFFNDYIERWATEALYYNKAADNVASTAEIERMVESYRRSLILSVYQDGLITQHLVPDITQNEIRAFYEQNSSMFELEESLMKGLLLKLPLKSPKMNDVRKWCTRRAPEDLESLEKYSIANASYYECFLDDWTAVGNVVAHTPLTTYQLRERLSHKSIIEFSDNGYVYFVGADTILPKGGVKPLEMVTAEIMELLVNSKKANFIKEKKRALYLEAQEKGEIERMDNPALPVVE